MPALANALTHATDGIERYLATQDPLWWTVAETWFSLASEVIVALEVEE